MKRYWQYFKYIVRHKWFVLIAGRNFGISFWRAIWHDMSKFRLSEWSAYAQTFYKSDGTKQYNETDAFNRAWLLHQRRNPHHWQYWVLRMDSGEELPIEIPLKYVLEMIADWMGAGRAITGTWDYATWYQNNQHKIILHDNTRKLVERIIEKTKP